MAADLDKVLALRRAGASYEMIGKVVGCSPEEAESAVAEAHAAIHVRRKLRLDELEQLDEAWCAIPAVGIAGDLPRLDLRELGLRDVG